MSKLLPAGNGGADGSAKGSGGSAVTVVSGGAVCSIDAAQQAHVHRTQNAGQPLSGTDSVVPIGQLSGTTSELTPLASEMSTASTAMNNARRMPANIPVGSSPRSLSGWHLPLLTPSNPSSILGQVVILIRRASAVVALLALVVGNVAVCAGWQATPEARMACCMNGTTCPMHKSDSHEYSSKEVFSQAQADSCCAAAAQRRDSAAAGSTFAVSGVIALVPVTMSTVPTGPIASQEWRALVPLPISSTPKHLLLSVFLV
jgi:hypothetical protein